MGYVLDGSVICVHNEAGGESGDCFCFHKSDEITDLLDLSFVFYNFDT